MLMRTHWIGSDVAGLLIGEASGPARLIREDPASVTDGLLWPAIIGFGVLAVAAGVVAVMLWRSRWVSHDPAGYAFCAMARAMRLRRRDRQTLRQLAQASGLPNPASPVGLLLSPAALETAIDRLSGARGDQYGDGEADPAAPDPASVDRLRRALRR